jgi:tripartite-type tricarboxylate transporter receptor subunit TctC
VNVDWLRYGCAVAAVAATGTLGAPTAASAEDYPTRPIRLLVVTAAGGLMDVAARVTAEHVGKALGQSIVIENRPGGGGNLGAEAVAKLRRTATRSDSFSSAMSRSIRTYTRT